MNISSVITSYEIVVVIGDEELFGERTKSCFDEHSHGYNYFNRVALMNIYVVIIISLQKLDC